MNSKMSIISIFLLTIMGIASQLNAQSEIANDKRLQLVNKLEFNSPIKDIAIGSENSVSFARVILTKDAIIFRNKKKEVINKYPVGKGSYLISSPSSEYSAVVSTIKGIEDKNDTGLSRLDFYDRSGKVLWQKDYEMTYDGHLPSFLITDNGSLIEVNRPYGRLSFYNKDGSLLKKIDTAKGYRGEVHRAVLSFDSKNIIVATLYQIKPEWVFRIYYFSSDGEELWTYDVHTSISPTIINSPEGNTIAVSVFQMKTRTKKSVLLKSDGSKIAETEFKRTMKPRLSPNGYNLLLQEKKNSIIKYDYLNSSRVFKYEFEGKLLGLEFGPKEHEHLLLIGKANVRKPMGKSRKERRSRERESFYELELVSVDNSGSPKSLVSIETNSLQLYEIAFLVNNNTVFIKTPDAIYSYSLK